MLLFTRRRLPLALLALWSCLSPNQEASAQQPSPMPQEAEPKDVYAGLRTLALEARIAGAQASVALMEINLGQGMATLAVLADGTTSLYLSTGGGVLGAGEHESVRQAAHVFLQTALAHAASMQETEERPLPSAHHVRFYLVTNEALLTTEVAEQELARGGHPLSDLFAQGHKVIAAVIATRQQR